MTKNNLKMHPTEADLEAEIHCVLKAAFPWIKPKDLRHQTRFSFTFGRSSFEVDGTTVSKAAGRSDILIYHRDTPLAVLELKRSGLKLTDKDSTQGLSYARMLHPQPPLVVVTNGKDTRFLATYTGKEWVPTNPFEEELTKLISSAGKIAEASMQHAVEVLLGPNSCVWAAAIRASTILAINDLVGEWNDSLLPFVSDFLIPRHATERVFAELKGSKRIIILNGPPLVGKSCVLRELCSKTTVNDDFVFLFIEADGNAGSGLIRGLANLLAGTLGWSVSLEETRMWLRRLSSGTGPTLVLVIDGVSVVRTEVRCDIEELISDTYGAKLRVVLSVDDTILDSLILNETGRKKTRIGRFSSQVPVGPLDATEFQKALAHLKDVHHINIMKGGNTAPEFRTPWILRSLVAGYVSDPKYKRGFIPVLPPLLGLDLVEHVRERFEDDHELRRQYQELAQAVLLDRNDHKRPVSLILESISAYVVRRKTLQNIMVHEDISSLGYHGYLKPRMHASNEAIFVPHLPELLLSEIALRLGKELNNRIMQNLEKAADWLVSCTSELPLGDLIGAQAILDCKADGGRLPLDFISHLLTARPHRKGVRPGTRAALHIPGTGMVELLFNEDGTILANCGGRKMTIEKESDDFQNEMFADVESWLILSHLSSYELIAESHPDGQIIGSVDPAILMEVGTCKMVLRRPCNDIDENNILVHDIPGHGPIVCHKAGIVEPITLSILKFLSREGLESTDWIKEAIDRNSYPLLARVDIALKYLVDIVDAQKAKWAREMLTELVTPAFKNFPAMH